MHLPHRHRQFVHRFLTGTTAKAAYLHAFPHVKPSSARSAGPRLAKNPKIQAELTALRQKAESLPDADFLTYVETRKFHARVVRARAALLPDDSPLWDVKKAAKGNIYLRFPDKLRTLALDAKLAGYHRPPPTPTLDEHDELAALLERVRDASTLPWRRSSTPSESMPSMPSIQSISPPPVISHASQKP